MLPGGTRNPPASPVPPLDSITLHVVRRPLRLGPPPPPASPRPLSPHHLPPLLFRKGLLVPMAACAVVTGSCFSTCRQVCIATGECTDSRTFREDYIHLTQQCTGVSMHSGILAVLAVRWPAPMPPLHGLLSGENPGDAGGWLWRWDASCG